MDEKIRYVRLEDRTEKLESVLDLLYQYLSQFISRETLKEDIEYCFKKGRVVAAYHKEKLIGAVVGIHTPFFDKFHIAHIAVKEGHQGKGIGKRLTEEIIPEGTGASVHLNIGNPGVERFYEKMGFSPTHKRFKKPAEEDSDVKPSD
ncbi:MAG: GNAT family N-acetyltransferase [Candidatus Natronoplasma sp.]